MKILTVELSPQTISQFNNPKRFSEEEIWLKTFLAVANCTNSAGKAARQ